MSCRVNVGLRRNYTFNTSALLQHSKQRLRTHAEQNMSNITNTDKREMTETSQVKCATKTPETSSRRNCQLPSTCDEQGTLATKGALRAPLNCSPAARLCVFSCAACAPAFSCAALRPGSSRSALLRSASAVARVVRSCLVPKSNKCIACGWLVVEAFDASKC